MTGADTCIVRPLPDITRHAQRAVRVGLLSLIAMVLELAAGFWLNSMALVSDGFHTFTHVGAMALATGAYAYVRRRENDTRFAFGTGKMLDLAAFASGVGLAVIGLFIGLESLQRLWRPEFVALREAAVVAILSLLVGLASAALLRDRHAHGVLGTIHVEPSRLDLNLWAAYLHMVADVLTSVLEIAALLVGAAMGWMRLDATVGLLNAVLVMSFGIRLIRRASATLLDFAPERALGEARSRLGPEIDPTAVRVWRIAPGRIAVAIRAGSGGALVPEEVRTRLAGVAELAHVFFEAEPESQRPDVTPRTSGHNVDVSTPHHIL